MTVSPRKSRNQPGAPATDFPELAADVAETAAFPDPALLAVHELLTHALTSAGTDFSAVGREGVVALISVPDSSWTSLALDAWTENARGGQESEDGSRNRWYRPTGWLSFAPRELGATYKMADAAESFAAAISNGLHVAGFAADLSWLPSDLVAAADYRLTLPLMSGLDVAAVAKALCSGEQTVVISDELAALVSPRLLRLARRRDQAVDGYLCKLIALIERDRTERAAVARAPSTSVRNGPTLARLHGMAEAVTWGFDLAKDLQEVRDGRISWSEVDRGLLLSGPPGCGKTLFARALATTCEVPLVTGSYGEWHGTGSAHQGDLLKAMRKTFTTARDSAPSILFIDEVDSFPDRGTITHRYADWEVQVVNALLAEIDGVASREGVILVAACNHPDKLDPALVRSGRLDRHIRIQMPDRLALASILREHLDGELADTNLDGAALAALGSSGADVERFVRGARRRSRAAGRPLILDDLIDEIGGADERSAHELYVAAVHEAGHALVWCHLSPGLLQSVTLRRRGDVGGAILGAGGKAYVSQSDIRHCMIVILAGRAAEQVVLGMPSSSAGGDRDSDLAQATKLAATAAVSLGLDGKVGLLWSGTLDPGRNLFRVWGEQPMLAERVREVIDEAYAEALTLAAQRSAAIEALAARLIDKRVLDGREVAAVAAEYPADPACGSVP